MKVDEGDIRTFAFCEVGLAGLTGEDVRVTLAGMIAPPAPGADFLAIIQRLDEIRNAIDAAFEPLRNAGNGGTSYGTDAEHAITALWAARDGVVQGLSSAVCVATLDKPLPVRKWHPLQTVVAKLWGMYNYAETLTDDTPEGRKVSDAIGSLHEWLQELETAVDRLADRATKGGEA